MRENGELSAIPDVPLCNEDNMKDNIVDCSTDGKDCCGSVREWIEL